MKNGSFCEELLSENNFEAVLANFCCYDCGANASEAVQKISTRSRSCTSATPMEEVYYSFSGDTGEVSIFFLTWTKMSKEHIFIL